MTCARKWCWRGYRGGGAGELSNRCPGAERLNSQATLVKVGGGGRVVQSDRCELMEGTGSMLGSYRGGVLLQSSRWSAAGVCHVTIIRLAPNNPKNCRLTFVDREAMVWHASVVIFLSHSEA
jgi:hypothetical protein